MAVDRTLVVLWLKWFLGCRFNTMESILLLILQKVCRWTLRQCLTLFISWRLIRIWTIIQKYSVMQPWHSISSKVWIWRLNSVLTLTLRLCTNICQVTWWIWHMTNMDVLKDITQILFIGRKRLTWLIIRRLASTVSTLWPVCLGRSVNMTILECIQRTSLAISLRTSIWTQVRSLMLRRLIGNVGLWTPISYVSLIHSRIVTPLQLLVVMTVLLSLVRIINMRSSHQRVWLGTSRKKTLCLIKIRSATWSCILAMVWPVTLRLVFTNLWQQLQAKPYYWMEHVIPILIWIDYQTLIWDGRKPLNSI